MSVPPAMPVTARPAQRLSRLLSRSFALVAVLAVSTALLAVLVTGFTLQRSYARDNLRLLAQQAAYAAEIPVVFNDERALADALNAVLTSDNVATIVVDANGRQTRLGQSTADRGGVTGTLAPRLLLPEPVTMQIVSAGSPIGSVTLTSSGAGVGRLLIASIVGTLLCIAAIVLGTLAIARRLNRAMVRPLEHIAEVTHAVREEGRFDRRVPEAQIVEVDALVGDFNAMLTQLEEWQGQAARTHEALVHRASYDPLSGLPNRTTFTEQLRDAIRSAKRNDDRVGLLFLDGDNFKQTNDRFGHAAGDRVITEVAARIPPLLRVGDLVARIGGDEFAVLVHHIEGVNDAQMVARRIAQVMEAPVGISGTDSVVVGLSIGVAIYPDDGADVEQLMQIADDRMYAEKNARKVAQDETSNSE